MTYAPFALVQEKGMSYQHQRGPDDEEKIGVTMSMVWVYINSKDNEDDETGPPTCVAYDDNTKATWAMARQSKEITEDLVSWMRSNSKNAGYSGMRITLKSDGEVSMKALKNQMALKRESPTSIIHTPVRESKANGAMEASIRSWKGQVRTIRLYLEHRLKVEIEFGHPVLTWLTFWSSEIINKFRARNGRTASELMTGHRVRHLVIGFGEKIMGQFTADKNIKNDHDTRWFEAFFLGVETCSGCYLVVNSDGICKIANIRRLLDENAYDQNVTNNLGQY